MKKQGNTMSALEAIDALFSWAKKLDYTIRPDIQQIKTQVSNSGNRWKIVVEDNRRNLRYTTFVVPREGTNAFQEATESLKWFMLKERTKETKITDYVEVMYGVAAELQFVVHQKIENTLDEDQTTKTYITQFDVEDINGDVRFLLDIDRQSRINTASKAALILIMAMYKERSIPFDVTNLAKYVHSSNHKQKQNNKAPKSPPKKESHGITAKVAPATNVKKTSQHKTPEAAANNEKKQNITKTTQKPIKVAYTFKVYNSSGSISRNQCPECGAPVVFERRNIPAFTSEGNFHQYYICNVWICNRCHETFMSTAELKNLQMRLSGSTRKLFVEPSNRRRVEQNNSYLYEPIDNHNIYVNTHQVNHLANTQIQSNNNPFSTMQTKSFLKEAGYSTSVSTDKRRAILRELVKKYGKRQVTDYLKTFINLHGKRRNYANAVTVWQSDLNYIARL